MKSTNVIRKTQFMKGCQLAGILALIASPAFAASMKRDLAINLTIGDVHSKTAEDSCEAQCKQMEAAAKDVNPAFNQFSNLTCEVRIENGAGECVLTGVKSL